MPEPQHVSFHRRFNIPVDRDTAEAHFVNRVLNFISREYPDVDRPAYTMEDMEQLIAIASHLGERFKPGVPFENYVRGDFYRCLHALEGLYSTLYAREAASFSQELQTIISQSDFDLGIRWQNGVFLPSGAELLDEAIVNDNLRWLSSSGYENVLAPFQKGLSEFLQGTRDAAKYTDGVRDMYEALEALAKVVTGRPNRDLSANRELFVTKLGLTHFYAKMLSDYIAYACEFRHGVDASRARTPPPPREVEAFIYTTGLFIRLALDSTSESHGSH